MGKKGKKKKSGEVEKQEAVSVDGMASKSQYGGVFLALIAVIFAVSVSAIRVHFHFGEQGNYSLWVKNLSDPNHINCTIVTVTEPVNSYLPLLIALVVCVAVCVLATVWSAVMRLSFVSNLLLRVGSSMEAERLINSDLGSPSRICERELAEQQEKNTRLQTRLTQAEHRASTASQQLTLMTQRRKAASMMDLETLR
ncbi:hypothetical protein PGIGA_G00176830 [Pangasianodon gigas]|uniref:Uncharacterized protein n=1 Tax=Pangasianodon gigas TaxID=30993 RepID=A0ACC5XV19_PANGG|nr:hypothetical protein [Pangasianodon gigas]